MRWLLLAVTFIITGSVMAEAGYYGLGEAVSLRRDQSSLEVGYRQHTAPSLTEFARSGVRVDWLEVQPTQIDLSVGEAYSLGQLRVMTYAPDGSVAEHVPLSLDFEGPPDLLELESWKEGSDEIIAATAGAGTIWVVSLALSSTDEHVRQPIGVIVR